MELHELLRESKFAQERLAASASRIAEGMLFRWVENLKEGILDRSPGSVSCAGVGVRVNALGTEDAFWAY